MEQNNPLFIAFQQGYARRNSNNFSRDWDEFKTNYADLFQPPSPAKAEQPFNRDENSIEGKAAIEFYEWLQRSSMAKAEVPINIKWRMFVDQKNVKQKNNQ